MDLKLNGEEGDMSTFVLNGEWALLGMQIQKPENWFFLKIQFISHFIYLSTTKTCWMIRNPCFVVGWLVENIYKIFFRNNLGFTWILFQFNLSLHGLKETGKGDTAEFVINGEWDLLSTNTKYENITSQICMLSVKKIFRIGYW